MNGKATILSIVLAIGAESAGSHSIAGGSSPSPPSQDESPSRLNTMEQRSLLRHCLYTAELAEKHNDELLRSATHGRPDVAQIQQHLREIGLAVRSMSELHKRFLYGLTEKQWKSAKEQITALERIRIAVQVQLDGIDLELQMPKPDSKVLARYDRKMKTLLENWRKQHRKLGEGVGIKL